MAFDHRTPHENMRAKQRADSENIAAGKRAGKDASEALARMKELSADVKKLTEQARSRSRAA